MLHYIRDLLIARRPSADYAATNMLASYIFYHFLRVMGWTWLWECDTINTVSNHCPDGDMEDTGTSNWTALGTASLAKDSASKHQGHYALEVSSAALNDGVRSAALTSMEDSTTYRVALWASNDTGSAWNVDVDDGSGSFSNVGTIPDNSGTWTLYHFSFTTAASGTRYLRVVDNNATSGDIYLDDINIFRSWFEYNGVSQSGTDGYFTNNEFASFGYTFVGGDVGKVLVLYASHAEEFGISGAYVINSISSGRAVLTLRMGGSEQIPDTIHGDIVWRVVDLSAAPMSSYAGEGGTTSEAGAGWGLASPHSSKWRLFFRHRAGSGSTARSIMTWSSPIESEFSVMDGVFQPYNPSTFQPRGETYDYGGYSTVDGWFLVGNGGDASETHKRLYAMVSDGGEIASIVTRTVPEDTDNMMGFFGLTGTDARHISRESHVHFAKRNGSLTVSNELRFESFSNDGACGTDETTMPPASVGYWSCSTNPISDANAKANPFSGDEWLMRLLVLRDKNGDYGFYSEKELDVEDAIWACRANLTEFQPFSPITGTGDSFAFSTPTVTLTDAAGDFTQDMVGREITIAGATSPGNDGTFVVASYISATQITYSNVSGVAEAFSGTWSVGPQYFHFEQGVCWKWPGFTALA